MDNLPNCCRQCWQKKRNVDHGPTEDSHAQYNIVINNVATKASQASLTTMSRYIPYKYYE